MELSMSAMKRRAGFVVRAVIMSSFVLALVGCGGGGGEGTQSQSSVTVNAPSLKVLNAEVLEGTALSTVVLTGSVSGDVTNLAGRTLYVVVEDPATLFESNAMLQLQQSGGAWLYTLNLVGRPLATVGRRTGTLRVFVCLDAACATQLNGTPIAIPFDVNVLAPMTLSAQSLQFSVPFGTLLGEQVVDVGLSPLSTTWAANDVTPYNPYQANPLQLLNGGQLNSAGPLRFKLAAAVPGTYSSRISVITQPQVAPDRTMHVEQFIDVTYTVTANDALDHVFDPPALNLVHSATNPLLQEHGYQLLTNTGYTSSWAGVVFDPPQVANPTGPYNNWWSGSYSYACIGTVGGSMTDFDCMQPGVYTARVQYQVSGPSGSHIVELPITMTVTP
jgi:hypothetical protein